MAEGDFIGVQEGFDLAVAGVCERLGRPISDEERAILAAMFDLGRTWERAVDGKTLEVKVH